MSMMQLLTAGKSLVGLQDSNSRYQLRTKNALPRFNSTRHPRSAPAGPVQNRSTARAVPEGLRPYQRKPQGPVPSGASEPVHISAVGVSVGKAQDHSPARDSSPAVNGLSKLAVALKSACGRARFLADKFKSSVRGLKQPPIAKSLVSKGNRSPVQVELSLDKVRVLRNDLSEADLEVVPLRIPAVKGGAESAPRAVGLDLVH